MDIKDMPEFDYNISWTPKRDRSRDREISPDPDRRIPPSLRKVVENQEEVISQEDTRSQEKFTRQRSNDSHNKNTKKIRMNEREAQNMYLSSTDDDGKSKKMSNETTKHIMTMGIFPNYMTNITKNVTRTSLPVGWKAKKVIMLILNVMIAQLYCDDVGNHKHSKHGEHYQAGYRGEHREYKHHEHRVQSTDRE